MDMVAWKAWYRGGEIFCSPGTEWEDLPDEGVVGVAMRFDNGHYRVMTGSDYYWMVEILGKLTLCQGLHEDKPAERYPGASIKVGVWTSDEEMQRVLQAMADWQSE